MASHTPGNPTQAVLDDLRRLVQYLRVASLAAERSIGLSGAQLFVLEKLAQAPFLSVNDLAERTRTHQSSVSVVASKLAEKGLIARRTSPQDARRAELSLTAAGKKLLKGAPVAPQHRLIEALEQMPKPQLADLGSSLKVLVETLGLDTRAPMMFEEEAEGPAGKKTKGKA